MQVSSRTEEKLRALKNHQCRGCKFQQDPFRTCGAMTPQEALAKRCYKREVKNNG